MLKHGVGASPLQRSAHFCGGAISITARVLGANDRINFAVIGLNGQRSRTIGTGKDVRIDNMRAFSVAALALLETHLA